MRLLLALLLSGCVAPLEGGFDYTGEAPSDGVDLPTPQDLRWDAAPPDVAVGSSLVAVLNCGMLEGDSDVYWRFDGGGWEAVGRQDNEWFTEVEAEAEFGGRPYAPVESCFTSGSSRALDWGEDGSFVFYNGNWAHELHPSATEGVWVGTVRPMFDVSEDCLDGLEELGLEPPVGLSLTVLGSTDGSYAFQ